MDLLRVRASAEEWVGNASYQPSWSHLSSCWPDPRYGPFIPLPMSVLGLYPCKVQLYSRINVFKNVGCILYSDNKAASFLFICVYTF